MLARRTDFIVTVLPTLFGGGGRRCNLNLVPICHSSLILFNAHVLDSFQWHHLFDARNPWVQQLHARGCFEVCICCSCSTEIPFVKYLTSKHHYFPLVFSFESILISIHKNPSLTFISLYSFYRRITLHFLLQKNSCNVELKFTFSTLPATMEVFLCLYVRVNCSFLRESFWHQSG